MNCEDVISEQKKKRTEICNAFKLGYTTKEVSEQFHLSISRVSTIRKEEGLPKPYTSFQRDVKKLREKGLNAHEISEITSKSTRQVIAAMHAVGMEYSDEERKNAMVEGSAIGASKIRLSNSKVEALVKSKFPDLRYVSGYESMDKPVNLKCEICGMTFVRSMASIRHGTGGCPTCKNAYVEFERNRRLEDKRILKEKQNSERVLRSQRNRFIRDNNFGKQISMAYCKWCGTPFIPTSRGVYCCTGCAKKSMNHRKDRRIAKEAYIDKDITWQKLRDRDGCKCYLCGRPIDENDIFIKNGAYIAGDNYPSVDHVRPISKGGRHEWDNVRLAHRKCNTLKGDRYERVPG